MKTYPPFDERLDAVLARCERVGGCLVYPAQRGRPKLTRDGKVVRLAVAVLERKLGSPLAVEGMALHSCDVLACVEREHLHEGTHATNAAEASARGRLQVGDAHWTRRSPGRRKGPTPLEFSDRATRRRERRKR